ncbi:GntR family transcriptional regulator [Rhizocola hellebori]|uniref:GntR family transcriptional regulator n=1 Tax=Rhizocola hellebori TaxID=1392758 RepID=A0A8J3VHZ5_9ACTN|nr:PLP-dependent aminotransferase family protein [Rhizocola hellebori]GIH06777.1 GntR family transcriptional regulator [Rhizocola hellebori]
MVELIKEALHVSVSDPVATSMNFLNEVAGRYPEAISLAAGRPYEGFYEATDITRYIDIYLEYLRERGVDPRRALMQYGRTNGQIHDLIARLLATDDGIVVAPEAIAVTAGCQEAMVIVLRALCAGPGDVLLAMSPCYVGITGAARLVGIEVVPVPEHEGAQGVARVAREVRAIGKNPRALYLVPDFSNPGGDCLDLPERHRLLEIAQAEDLLILEDDPYGLFGLDDRERPKLKALDTQQRVIYLGSFAKSCFPGARVGFLVADQTVVDASGGRTLLADELSNIKSMLTVNTSPVSQAVIGGVLLESKFSLRAANKAKIEFYRQNLRALLSALQEHMPAGITWNTPAGGFFAVVQVPLVADEKLLEISASEYGVLWTPMSFFYTGGEGSHSLRLSCSYLDQAQIEEGVRRLARLIGERQ